MVDYHDNVFSSFSGAGASLIYDDVFIDRYYDYLESNNKTAGDISLGDLTKHTLRLTDEDGNPHQRFPIFNCLIFDTTLNGGSETFHLCEGNWYRIENEYVAKLKTYLDPLYADLALPPYNHDGEGAYNEAVAAGDPAIVCLDKGNIAAPGQTQIEPCDLYTVTDGHCIFNHVKISTLSAQLSHLFNQGTNAIELLKLDPESVDRLKAGIEEKAAEGTAQQLLQPLDDQKFHVVFGIVTHKDKQLMSDNLPLFSRISLMRNMKALQVMSVRASFGFIEDISPKNQGRKKKRKNNAEGEAG